MLTKFIFLLIVFAGNAQNPNGDKVLSIKYDVKFNHPSLVNSVIKKYQLLIDEETYKYEFLKQENSNPQFKKMEQEYFERFYSYHIGSIKDRIDFHLTNDGSKKTEYNIVDTLPEIKWKILNEKQKIGKYVCDKAVGNYRGRNIEAFFTPDIPIAIGPNNLNGLPGAIIYAKSHDGEFSFIATKIEKIERPDSFIKFDSFNFGATTSLRSYLKEKNEKLSKRLKKLKMQFSEKIRNEGSESEASTAKVSNLSTSLELFYEWQLVDEEKK
ncbi:GLPGLI family protein [Nonlabens sp.]|uniref:GLPGLI family protein n=1 Tax=Nonlabens sp. TaxID=1888209 RepID=UPI003F6A026C